MEDIKNWYVVYTRPKWEKKIVGSLERSGIGHYCPLHKVERQWSDRKKIITVPLFTSYVFIHAAKTEHGIIRDIDGVINFVYWLGKPAVIKDTEIAVVKEFLSCHKNIMVEQIMIGVGDIVNVVEGPLAKQQGKIVEVKNRTVKVLLPSLGYALMAEVEKVNIKLVAPIEEPYKVS